MAHLLQLWSQDCPNWARVYRTIRMTARLSIDRARVLAGPAANAVKCLPPFRISQHIRARIVHEYNVERPWTIVLTNASPDGVVRIHALPGRRSRKNLEHHLQILKTGEHFINSRNRNQCLGQRQAHPAVSFALNDAHTTRFGDQEVCPTHCSLDSEKLLAQKSPRRIGKVLGFVSEFRQIHLALEYLTNLLAILVEGGDHNM